MKLSDIKNAPNLYSDPGRLEQCFHEAEFIEFRNEAIYKITSWDGQTLRYESETTGDMIADSFEDIWEQREDFILYKLENNTFHIVS